MHKRLPRQRLSSADRQTAIAVNRREHRKSLACTRLCPVKLFCERRAGKPDHERTADRNRHQGWPGLDFHRAPRPGWSAPDRGFPHGRSRDPRGVARHVPALRILRLLRDAAQSLLPGRRRGTRKDRPRSGIGVAQADVRPDEFAFDPDGARRRRGDAEFRGRGRRRRHHPCRRHRILHERPLRSLLRGALSRSGQGDRFHLWRETGDGEGEQSPPCRQRLICRVLLRMRRNRPLGAHGDGRADENGSG